MAADAPKFEKEGLRAWRSRGGVASGLVFALIIAAASAPYAGWRVPLAWFVAMAGLVVAGQMLEARRAGRAHGGSEPFNPFAWLSNAGYSAAALYLVFFFDRAAQTLGVTLYGVVMFQILAHDYASPKRLVANLLAPILSVVAIQSIAATMLVQAGHPWRIVTLIASPLIVFIVFRAVQHHLNRNRRLEQEAAEANAAAVVKSQFLANMSHEIRNPLTVVLGYGELLEKLAGQSEQARTYISRVSTGAKALLAIVDDVLDYSKLEAGKIELKPHGFALTAFLNETVEQFLTAATNRGLDLRIEQRGELPAIVRADRPRLQQVLSNLIGNAIKFTESGSVTVAVGYQPGPDPQLRFEVIDTGIGVSTDDAGRLFERFSQVDGSNARRAGGSGLGLAIAKGLVETMGGEIGVDSRPGAGSTFWFTIKAPAEESIDAPERPPSVTWDLRPLSVLMVEDVAVTRDLVSDILSPFGIQVTGAADGIEGVDAALGARFDLILMNLQMPRLDGLAATKAIRAKSDLSRATPIVALSANVVQALVDACLAAGMNDYIRKPIDMTELLAKIAHWTRDAKVASAAPNPPTSHP
jgi:signal transduction histidine kinase/ActR/RegA family two-component response regulator